MTEWHRELKCKKEVTEDRLSSLHALTHCALLGQFTKVLGQEITLSAFHLCHSGQQTVYLNLVYLQKPTKLLDLAKNHTGSKPNICLSTVMA